MEQKINDIICDNIKILCRSRKISIKDLSIQLGMGINAISDWRHSSPSVERLLRVADYFGVSVDYLCGRSENAPATAAGIISALKTLGVNISQLDKLTAEDAKIIAMILTKNK